MDRGPLISSPFFQNRKMSPIKSSSCLCSLSNRISKLTSNCMKLKLKTSKCSPKNLFNSFNDQFLFHLSFSLLLFIKVFISLLLYSNQRFVFIMSFNLCKFCLKLLQIYLSCLHIVRHTLFFFEN